MNQEFQIAISFVVFFLLAIGFSVVINGLFIRFSKTLGIRNNEDLNLIRWAATTKPSVGGFSFYIVFLLSFTAYAFVFRDIDSLFNKELIGLLLASSFGFLVGLADDAYNTNPLLKFLGQLTCGVILVVSGVVINISDYYTLNSLFTLFWVIAIMNSINMLDNMDGITASVSAIILLTCLVILSIEGHLFSTYSFLIIGVIGALGGFMVFNFNPSRIYMGDTGSQFLGVFLSGLGVILLWNFRDVPGPVFQIKQFLIPGLVFCIPVIDTTTVVIRRLLRKQSPFIGGKDHTTHHLAYLGLTDRQVFYALCLVSIFTSAMVCFFVYHRGFFKSETTIILSAYFIVLFSLMQNFYERGSKRRKEKEKQSKIKVA